MVVEVVLVVGGAGGLIVVVEVAKVAVVNGCESHGLMQMVSLDTCMLPISLGTIPRSLEESPSTVPPSTGKKKYGQGALSANEISSGSLVSRWRLNLNTTWPGGW